MISHLVSALAITPAALAWAPGHHPWGNHPESPEGLPHFGYVPGNNFGIPENNTFDYVVVGGGTGGLTMAYRLAEDGTKRVAVVEAGGFYTYENGNTSVVPAYCTQYAVTTEASVNMFPLVDWGFLTEPQEGLAGRRLHYGRGKTLGGRYVVQIEMESDSGRPLVSDSPCSR